MTNNNIELLAPAGSFAALRSAIFAQAASVYFGVGNLNMRARGSNNFFLEDLPSISQICKKDNVKSYLTLNTIIYDKDLYLMKKILDLAKKSNIDAVIASDIATISYARSIDLNVHISTQLNISNIESVRFFAQFADVLVLARELNLQQIQQITSTIKKENIKGPSGDLIKVEIFAHGAMCVAIAGKCYMSLAQYNLSANRGECLQACRRKYKIYEEDTGCELSIDNKYIMSPKDLCTITFLDKIIESGISILKIEGRARSPEYVKKVVTVYREALDSIFDKTYFPEKTEKWIRELKKVYNRGFWQGGYYLGKKLGEWSASYGSQASQKKIFLGKVTKYFSKAKVAEILLQTQSLKEGDNILIIGPTTGTLEHKIESILSHSQSANKGETVTITLPKRVRKNDQLFMVKENDS